MTYSTKTRKPSTKAGVIKKNTEEGRFPKEAIRIMEEYDKQHPKKKSSK